MSRLRADKPVFRLHLAYPKMTVERDGVPVGSVDVDAPERDAHLADLAARIAAEGGRLVAVVPEPEVWRVRLAGRPGGARLRAAAAAALGTGRIALVQGPADPTGRGVAAVRRSTLTETMAFLAGTGLRPDAIAGAGAFPGFAAPPEFAARGLRRALPSAPAAAGLATAAALMLTLALQPDAPVAPTPAPLAVLATSVEPVAPPEPMLAEAPPPQPRARPADFVALPPRAPSLPAPARDQGLRPAPSVAFAARNLPPEVQSAVAGLRPSEAPRLAVMLADGTAPVPRRRPATAAPVERQAALPVATDAVRTLAPRPRPAQVVAATPVVAPVAAPVSAVEPTVTAARPEGGPRPRPATQASSEAALAAAIGAAVAGVGAQAAEPVRVAALGSSAAVQALPTGTLVIPPPEPRRAATMAPARAAPAAQPSAAARTPAVVRAPAPAPVRAVPAQPVRAAAVQPVRAAPAQPVLRAAPVQQPARTARTAVIEPQPARAVAAPARTVRQQPATTPARTARAEPARPGSVALIGIFGKADQRHALVRLANGSTQRVKPGDSVAGVQVAGIGADSVRLAGGGRETVLRLPE